MTSLFPTYYETTTTAANIYTKDTRKTKVHTPSTTTATSKSGLTYKQDVGILLGDEAS